jgi:hypothetical protein
MRRSLIAFALLVSCPLLIAQQAMNNDSVIKLVKAGLSEDLIITTINASPANYDTSANGLIALKGAGVSDKVLSAIVVKSSGGAPSTDCRPESTKLAFTTKTRAEGGLHCCRKS